MRLSGRQIDCVRGGREVFSHLDFEAASGQALSITGPNGSGKTSLLRLIAGLLVPSGGSIDLEAGQIALGIAKDIGNAAIGVGAPFERGQLLSGRGRPVSSEAD